MNTLHRQFLGSDLSNKLTDISEDWKSKLMTTHVGLSDRGHLRPSSSQDEVQASVTPTGLSEPKLSTSAAAVTPEGPTSHCVAPLHAPDNEVHGACISLDPVSGAPEAATDPTALTHDMSSEPMQVQISWI